MPVSRKLQVFKCSICGNIVEVLTVGKGELVCCGQPMKALTEKTEDAGQEKGTIVRVGSIAHPMEKDHYIEWIEIIADGDVYRKFLHPGEKAEARFEIKAEKVMARTYCNIHSLWQS